MVRPRRSGFDSARACISSLPFKAVPAAGATGATNAAAPESARAATIFCIVAFLRGGGRVNSLGRLSSRSATSLCVLGALSGTSVTAAAGARSRSQDAADAAPARAGRGMGLCDVASGDF